MQYILLLRSVNLGKLRKVSMPELKKRLAALGYENVTSYINSGNDEYREDAHNLPEWWNEDMPRLDAMFFTIDADRDALAAELETLDVPDEVLHIGTCAVYFGNYSTPDYKKAQYGKFMSKKAFANQLTLRNAKTCNKILDLLD